TPEQAEFGGTDYLPTPYLSGDTTLYPRITDDITGCYTTGVTVDLNVIPAPIATPPAPIEECDFNNDGFAQFDMTGAMAAIEAALGNVEVTAYETPEDAEHDVNPIPNPDNYTNINQHGQTIYLRVQSTLTDCYDLVTLQLIVNPVPEATEPSDYALCDDGASDTDGIATFDLTIKAAEILGSLDPAQYSISYHVSNDDAVNGTPSIINAASYPSGTATIYVRVTNNTTGCYDIVTLELIVNPLPELITNQSVYTLCDTTAPMDKEVFDLTSRIPDFIADASGMTITFHHSFADAQGDTNPISETDALAYENQVPQVETLFVRFEVTATGCYRIGFLDLRVEHQPIILEPTQDELTVCDTNGQGIGEFDLAALEESMANGDPDLVITFHETAEDAIAGINPIPTTENYVNAVPYIQDIYVRVTDTRSGCSNTVPYVLTLIVSPAPQAPSLEDLTFCDDADNNGQDGKRRVDLTVQNAVIADALGLIIPDDLIVEYYTTETGANSGLANRITNPATYMGSDQQVIWVRVEDPVTGCYSVESFMLIFNAPHALTTPSPLAICNEALPNDGQTEFDLTVREDQLLGPSGIGQGYTVEYYESDPRVDTGAIAIADPEHYTNPAPPAGNPKTLFVKVTTQDGCVSYTTLTIKVLPLPTPDTTPDALVLCDDNGDGDGVEEFDLTQAAADIKNNGSNYILTYYTT
ncbi:hypothetical protein NHE85_11665, partial [Flavobacterium sp. NRK1]|nr:hypothetical protein [Flavobacterium sp. NRK1]